MAIYEELLKKCENIGDPDIMNTYKVLLKLTDKKKVKVEEKATLKWPKKPADIPRVLELALNKGKSYKTLRSKIRPVKGP